jgi:hypothetical protein
MRWGAGGWALPAMTGVSGRCIAARRRPRHSWRSAVGLPGVDFTAARTSRKVSAESAGSSTARATRTAPARVLRPHAALADGAMQPNARCVKHGQPKALCVKHGQPNALCVKHGQPNALCVKHGQPNALCVKHGRPNLRASRKRRKHGCHLGELFGVESGQPPRLEPGEMPVEGAEDAANGTPDSNSGARPVSTTHPRDGRAPTVRRASAAAQRHRPPEKRRKAPRAVAVAADKPAPRAYLAEIVSLAEVPRHKPAVASRRPRPRRRLGRIFAPFVQLELA